MSGAPKNWAQSKQNRHSTDALSGRSRDMRNRKFADLYGAFPVKRLFWVVVKFFVRSGKGRFSSRRLQSGSRSARKGSRDRNASGALAACRLSEACVSQRLDP